MTLRDIYHNLILALACLFWGWIVFFFADAAGTFVPWWPPAGFALAFWIVYGMRILPGLLMGALLAYGALLPVSTLSVPSIWLGLVFLALTSLGQVVFGNYLLRRFARSALLFVGVRNLWSFFLFGCVGTSLVGLSAGVVIHYVWASDNTWLALPHWFIWWCSNLFGLLLCTPLTLSWLRRRRDVWQERVLPLTLTMLLGGALVLTFFFFLTVDKIELAQEHLEKDAQRVTSELQRLTYEHVDILYATRAFYNSSEEVTREEFQTFASHFLERYPSIQALEWVPLVPHDQKTSFTEQLHEKGITSFEITQREEGQLVPVNKREVYYPVVFVEPLEGNEAALGFDLGSQPDRLKTIQQATRTGRETATPFLELVQSQEGYGFLIFLPIYQSGSVIEGIQGFALIVLRLNDLIPQAMSHLLADADRYSFRLGLPNPRTGFELYYEHNTDARVREEVPDVLHDVLTQLPVAGQTWQLVFSPVVHTWESVAPQEVSFVLLGVSILLVLLMFLILLVTGRQLHVQKIVSAKTRALRNSTRALQQNISALKESQATLQEKASALQESEARFRSLAENIQEVFWIITPDTREPIYVSPAFEKVWGHRLLDLYQDPHLWINTIHPEDQERVISKLFMNQQDSFEISYKIIRPDGEVRWIRNKGFPFKDASGAVRWMVGIAEDITDQRSALHAERLQELTKHLQEGLEQDRKRIAREVHDGLGQNLTAMKLLIANLSKTVGPAADPEILRQVQDLVDQSIQEVRSIAADLRPSLLDHLGLFEAIRWQVKLFEENAHLHCDLRLPEQDFVHESDIAATVYRIVQELLTNIIRHANASEVKIVLEQDNDRLYLMIEDNGKGISSETLSSAKGVGLVGIQERLRALGGRMDIETAVGNGMLCEIVIPLGGKKL